MTDTVFTDTVTLTDDDWFNDVNRLHYTIFGDPATAAAVVSTLKASQSQLESASTQNVVPTPGTMLYHPGVVKALARWSSTTTVPLSYNISTTIVKVATGQYTLRFLNSFSSSNAILPMFSCDDTGGICQGYVSTMTVSTCTVVYRNAAGASTDAPNFNAWFIGDL